MKFNSTWWTLEAPPTWDVSEDDSCVTLACNKESALQISAARKNSGNVTDADIKEFVGDHPEGRRLARFATPYFEGYRADYTKRGRHWKEWWLRSQDLLVYVTYNVKSPLDLPQEQQVEAIVHSIKRRF